MSTHKSELLTALLEVQSSITDLFEHHKYLIVALAAHHAYEILPPLRTRAERALKAIDRLDEQMKEETP